MDVSNNALRKLENVLHRGIFLPLQEIALRRVAASFWIDVLLSTNFSNNIIFSMARLNWYNYEDKVKDKASKVLPLSLKKQIMYIINPLGSSILSWLTYHEYIFDEMSKYANLATLKCLHWTCMGSIDYKKTAKTIIELEMFSVEMRYRLACLYCLEDNIRILWGKLPKESKKNFREEIKVDLDMQLEHYWAYLLSGEEYKLDIALRRQLPVPLSFNQFAFKLFATEGNKAATEYFFQKLTNEEREFCLVNTLRCVLYEQDKPYWGRIKFSKEDISVVVCYLFSQMKPEMQKKILNDCSCRILMCFLDWPLRDLFVEVANIIWAFIKVYSYTRLLTMMHESFVTSGCCPELFREFFRCSPCAFRKEFVDFELQFGYFFPEYFIMQDSETVKVIFENIDAPDVVRLVFSQRVFKFLCDFISTDKWHMVEACLQGAKLSDENRHSFKTNCLKFMATIEGVVSAKEISYKRKILVELIGEALEKSLDDKALGRVKKHSS